MFKRIVLVEVKEGADGVALWKYWADDYGPRQPGPVRHAISRVIQKQFGTGNLWGMADVWFDNEQSSELYQDKRRNDPEYLKPANLWHKWTVRAGYMVEEKRLFERSDWKSLTNPMVKRVSLLVPKEGMDLEATWKYWVDDFGPRHVGPGIVMTCINRLLEPPAGGLWGIAEAWYESNQDFLKWGASHQNDPEMKRRIDEWHNKWASHTAYIMEEKVLFSK